MTTFDFPKSSFFLIVFMKWWNEHSNNLWLFRITKSVVKIHFKQGRFGQLKRALSTKRCYYKKCHIWNILSAKFGYRAFFFQFWASHVFLLKIMYWNLKLFKKFKMIFKHFVQIIKSKYKKSCLHFTHPFYLFTSKNIC